MRLLVGLTRARLPGGVAGGTPEGARTSDATEAGEYIHLQSAILRARTPDRARRCNVGHTPLGSRNRSLVSYKRRRFDEERASINAPARYKIRPGSSGFLSGGLGLWPTLPCARVALVPLLLLFKSTVHD